MRQRVVGTLEWTALAAFAALFVARGWLPGWRTVNTDFPNYYLSARLFDQGISLDRLYDWIWFERQKDHAGIAWGPIGYGILTPCSALVMAPLAWLPPLVAKRCWLCLNLAMLGLTGALLRRMCQMPPRRIALLVLATMQPLWSNFEFGQQHVLVLLLLTVAAWLYGRGRELGAGSVLAVAAVLKLYPGLFALFFLLRRRWRPVLGLCVAGAALVALTAALLGVEPLRVYVESILPRALGGEGNDPYLGTNSPTSLLRRIFVAEPDQNPHPLFASLTAFAFAHSLLQTTLVVSGLWLTSREQEPRARLEWGAFVAFLLVVAPTSASYHYCALILATVLAVDRLSSSGRPRLAAVVAALHVAVCWRWRGVAGAPLEGWGALLGYARAYAMLAYWCAMVAALRPSRALREAPRVAAAFGAAGVLLFADGVVSDLRPVDPENDEGEHLRLVHPALIVAGPAAAPGGAYFARLTLDGWVLDRTGARLESQRGSDVLSATVAAQAGAGWLEVAGRRSRLARFSLDAPSIAPDDLPVEIEDAEQPGASPDGRWLGFLREERGRASLWIADRTGGPADAGREHRLVDASRDVLDFAVLDDGRVIFSARDGGAPALWTVGPWPDLTAHPVAEDRPARYPAVSADGTWLAYSVEERGAWRLRALEVQTGERRQLTHARCNAITPTWSLDGRSVVIASDCGKGVEQSSLRRVPFASPL
jgi:hypothetical protein